MAQSHVLRLVGWLVGLSVSSYNLSYNSVYQDINCYKALTFKFWDRRMDIDSYRNVDDMKEKLLASTVQGSIEK